MMKSGKFNLLYEKKSEIKWMEFFRDEDDENDELSAIFHSQAASCV